MIDRNDGQNWTLLDVVERLGPTTFSQLGTAPWSTGLNGNLTYCSDCTPGATCTGGGLGALATRLNGVWTCGGAGGGLAGTIGTIHLPMSAAQPPLAGAAAVYDASGTHGRLLFDAGTSECVFWGPLRMNSDYAEHAGLQVPVLDDECHDEWGSRLT